MGQIHLASDGSHLYFTDPDRGAVRRVPVDGGAVENVQVGRAMPVQIALHDGEVLWVEHVLGPKLWEGLLMRAAKVGGAPSQIARTSDTRSLAVDDDTVYLGTVAGLRKVPLRGGPVVDVVAGEDVGDVEAQRGVLAWTGTYRTFTTAPDGQSHPITDGSMAAVALDGNRVFVLGYGGGVMAIDRTTGTATQLAPVAPGHRTGDHGRGLVVDDTHVYWTMGGTFEEADYARGPYRNDGAVWRVAKSGGPAERIASARQSPGAITICGASVCWVDDLNGSILSLPRPSGVAASSDACERVCAYIEQCAPGVRDESCRPDCRAHLVQDHEPRDAPARAYERCARALSCEDVARSLSMNMGPLGYCYTSAVYVRDSAARR